jgi:hypothetical protein
MEDSPQAPNLWQSNPLVFEINKEELVHVKGLPMVFSAPEFWITGLFLTLLRTPKEVLEALVEAFNSLL